MKKDLFNDIEIPTSELDHAIRKGIQKGKRKKQSKSIKIVKATLAIAASLLIAVSLGAVSEPIAHAMSSLPLVGDALEEFYTEFEGVYGVPEQSEIQVQEDGMVVSDQGIDCQVLGAYNHLNGTVGIIFQYSGDVDEDVMEHYHNETYEKPRRWDEPETDIDYYFGDFKGDPKYESTMETMTSQEENGIYTYQLEISFKDEVVENLETLPITFTTLGGKEGEWHFDVPLQDDPNYTDLGGEQYSNGDVTIQFDSLYQEDDMTKIYSTAIIDINASPDANESINDINEILITFEDEQGQPLPVVQQEIPYGEADRDNHDLFIYTIETELGAPIPADCAYITAFVEVTFESGDVVTLDPIQLDL